jgi:hypothetical protein
VMMERIEEDSKEVLRLYGKDGPDFKKGGLNEIIVNGAMCTMIRTVHQYNIFEQYKDDIDCISKVLACVLIRFYIYHIFNIISSPPDEEKKDDYHIGMGGLYFEKGKAHPGIRSFINFYLDRLMKSPPECFQKEEGILFKNILNYVLAIYENTTAIDIHLTIPEMIDIYCDKKESTTTTTVERTQEVPTTPQQALTLYREQTLIPQETVNAIQRIRATAGPLIVRPEPAPPAAPASTAGPSQQLVVRREMQALVQSNPEEAARRLQEIQDAKRNRALTQGLHVNPKAGENQGMTKEEEKAQRRKKAANPNAPKSYQSTTETPAERKLREDKERKSEEERQKYLEAHRQNLQRKEEEAKRKVEEERRLAEEKAQKARVAKETYNKEKSFQAWFEKRASDIQDEYRASLRKIRMILDLAFKQDHPRFNNNHNPRVHTVENENGHTISTTLGFTPDEYKASLQNDIDEAEKDVEELEEELERAEENQYYENETIESIRKDLREASSRLDSLREEEEDLVNDLQRYDMPYAIRELEYEKEISTRLLNILRYNQQKLSNQLQENDQTFILEKISELERNILSVEQKLKQTKELYRNLSSTSNTIKSVMKERVKANEKPTTQDTYQRENAPSSSRARSARERSRVRQAENNMGGGGREKIASLLGQLRDRKGTVSATGEGRRINSFIKQLQELRAENKDRLYSKINTFLKDVKRGSA